MSSKKVTELPLEKKVKHLLLVAQKVGLVKIGGKSFTDFDATPITLIGLCAILSDNNIGGINEIVEFMEESN